MKNIFKLSALAVLAVGLLASCEKKEIAAPDVPVAGEARTFTLSFAPATKVAVTDAGKTTWEVGDKILIHGEGSSNKAIVTLTDENIVAGGKKAVITVEGVEPYDRFSDRGYTSTFYAQYPAENASEGNFYYYAQFAKTNGLLMAGYNVGDDFVFHNLCGVISFKASGDFDSYTFEGNDGETVGYTDFRSRLAAKGEEDPVLEYKYRADGALTSIDGVAAPGETAYIGLPLGTNFTKGFKITLKKGETPVAEFSTDKAVNVERNKLLPLADITSQLTPIEVPYSIDLTPSAEYLAATNLWKAVFDADGEEVSGNIAGYEVKGIADVPAIVKNQSTYKMHFNGATSGDWANCNFLAPVPANAIPLAAGKQYNFSFTVAASKALPRMFLKMTTYDASKTANHEGAYVWETTKALEAETPITVTDVINGVACDNISFTLDFGGNPENVDIFIKDIIIEEVVVPAKFQWREDSVAEQTAAYNTPGAAHWYIDADADVEWNAVVKLDGVETTEAVTVEHFDVGGGHIAINYAANETLADKVWEITVTTEANVENKTLTAKLTQGAYEYTDLAKLNADIIADGSKTVKRVINIPESAKLVVTLKDGRSVFAQSMSTTFTGGVLLYLNSDDPVLTALYECQTICGKLTATTTTFSGTPEITAIEYEAGAVTLKKEEKYPCENVTIADLKANYNKYVNAKVKIVNLEATKGFSPSSKTGELKDATGTVAAYIKSSKFTQEVVTGSKLNYIVAWPTYFNTTQQLGLWTNELEFSSIPSTITMPETKSLGVGDTFELAATTNSTATITYVSSNKDVATVSEAGVVSALAAGEATITASVAKEGIYTAAEATCVVTVTEGGPSIPDPETIVFANLGLENGTQYSSPFDGGNFTITFAGGANDGKYYTTGTGIRIYGGGSATIASEYTISEIVFTWDGSNCPDADVATPTGYSTETKTWTGSAKSVVLTRPSGSGHWRLQSVKVTYTE